MDRPGWFRRWSPPADWPKPPPGWRPYFGWRPGPTWPPAPLDHVWWQRDRRGRWLLGFWLAIVGLVLCSCAVFLGVSAAHGPCWFDPPPGDMGTIPIINDTDRAVSLGDCDDRACASRLDPTALAPGSRTDYMYEMCGGVDVGVDSVSGRLLGCLVMPIGEPPKITRLLVSQTRPCVPG